MDFVLGVLVVGMVVFGLLLIVFMDLQIIAGQDPCLLFTEGCP
ncbi:hypothetical protein LCGC14_2790830 [marine sediment metagenome]|uniref:Uncharacterized protein n=1 Tax=marine sediment metagenome TaxID=412755 RepID=A0A0F8ZCN6_9ZZZZ